VTGWFLLLGKANERFTVRHCAFDMFAPLFMVFLLSTESAKYEMEATVPATWTWYRKADLWCVSHAYVRSSVSARFQEYSYSSHTDIYIRTGEEIDGYHRHSAFS